MHSCTISMSLQCGCNKKGVTPKSCEILYKGYNKYIYCNMDVYVAMIEFVFSRCPLKNRLYSQKLLHVKKHTSLRLNIFIATCVYCHT